MQTASYATIAPTGFGLGWRPELEEPAEERWSEVGGPAKYAPTYFAGGNKRGKPAYTLAGSVDRLFGQGPIGSSFATATVNAIQVAASVAGKGPGFLPPLSRRWVWYHARKLERTHGTANEGGSVASALRSVWAYGIAPEYLYGYMVERRYLDRPIAERDGKYRPEILGIVRRYSLDRPGEIGATLEAGQPIILGLCWPEGWNRELIDYEGRTIGVGTFAGYHAVCLVGKVEPGVWDRNRWYHVLNSHGPCYPAMSRDMAGMVIGNHDAIKSEAKRFSFWVREDHLATVLGPRQSLMICPAWRFSGDAA